MQNWFAAAAAGLLTIFGAGHAPATTTDFHSGSSTRIETHTGSSTKPMANISCISAAVATRESSLGAAVSTYTTAISGAYTARSSALANAYSLTGNDAIRAAVKDAWKQFSNASQGARRAWQKSRENAWTTFRTAVKACGPTAASVADTANSGSELNGQ